MEVNTHEPPKTQFTQNKPSSSIAETHGHPQTPVNTMSQEGKAPTAGVGHPTLTSNMPFAIESVERWLYKLFDILDVKATQSEIDAWKPVMRRCMQALQAGEPAPGDIGSSPLQVLRKVVQSQHDRKHSVAMTILKLTGHWEGGVMETNSFEVDVMCELVVEITSRGIESVEKVRIPAAVKNQHKTDAATQSLSQAPAPTVVHQALDAVGTIYLLRFRQQRMDSTTTVQLLRHTKTPQQVQWVLAQTGNEPLIQTCRLFAHAGDMVDWSSLLELSHGDRDRRLHAAVRLITAIAEIPSMQEKRDALDWVTGRVGVGGIDTDVTVRTCLKVARIEEFTAEEKLRIVGALLGVVVDPQSESVEGDDGRGNGTGDRGAGQSDAGSGDGGDEHGGYDGGVMSGADQGPALGDIAVEGAAQGEELVEQSGFVSEDDEGEDEDTSDLEKVVEAVKLIDEGSLPPPTRKTIAEADIRRILGRHRITIAKTGQFGEPLAESTLKKYTGILRSIAQRAGKMFPHNAAMVIDLVKTTMLRSFKDDSRKPDEDTVRTRISNIDTFMKCLAASEDDDDSLAEEKARERRELFGSEEGYDGAYHLYHQEHLRLQALQHLKEAGPAELTAAEKELWVDLGHLEKKYEARVAEVEVLMAEMEDLETRGLAVADEKRFALQDFVNASLYIERPPVRSEEYWSLRYSPVRLTPQTNYVGGACLIIQKDKTSNTRGTVRYEMKGVLLRAMSLLIRCHISAGVANGHVFQTRKGDAYTLSGFNMKTYAVFSDLVGKRLGCRILRKIFATGMTARGELTWPEQRKKFHDAMRHSGAVADRYYIIRLDNAPTDAPPIPCPEDAVIDVASDEDVAMDRLGTPDDTEMRQGLDLTEGSSEATSNATTPEGKDGNRKRRRRAEVGSGTRLTVFSEGEDEDAVVGVVKKKKRVVARRWTGEQVEWIQKNKSRYVFTRGGKEEHNWAAMAEEMSRVFSEEITSKQIGDRVKNEGRRRKAEEGMEE